MLQCGWQNFGFVIHYFSKSSPAFLYCNHRSNAFMAKKTELPWQRTCNKKTYSDSGHRSRFYICDSRPAADRVCPRRKQREQELRDWAPPAEWLDGKREENDDVTTVHNGKMTHVQEKTITEPERTKTGLRKQVTQAKLHLQNIFQRP